MRNNISRLSLAIAALLATGAVVGQDREDPVDDGITETPDVSRDNPGIGDNQGFGDDDAFGDDEGFDDDSDDLAEDADDAEELIDEAVTVVNQMKADPEAAQLLDQALGVFIIPDYAQAAVLVGGQGGEGVALMRRSGAGGADWTSPAFYNFGGATFGAAAGVEAGSIAMLLMSEDAVRMFQTEENNFSLDASAGLTIVDFSARAEASAGRGDVVVWSDTQGAFAGATIGVSDINRDDDEMEAYYGESVDTREVLSGNYSNERGQNLREALSG